MPDGRIGPPPGNLDGGVGKLPPHGGAPLLPTETGEQAGGPGTGCPGTAGRPGDYHEVARGRPGSRRGAPGSPGDGAAGRGGADGLHRAWRREREGGQVEARGDTGGR